MNEGLSNKVEELALLLVMASVDDPSSVAMVAETVTAIQGLASESPAVAAACAATLERMTGPDALGAATELASKLNAFIAGDAHALAATSTPPQGDQGGESPEFAASLDSSFITEFIESHSLLLEEFEGSLVASKSEGEDSDELTKAVKRYLHNLKGDAGSVGLLGIERVCHAVEDLVVESGAASLVPQLLSFKEWVVHYMQSLKEGCAVKCPSHEFLAGLATKSPPSQAAPTPTTPSAISSPPEAKTPSSAPSPSHASTGAGDERLPESYRVTGEIDILIEFTAEAEEHLSAVESIILDSSGEYSKDSVDAIFRAVHSIKGGSAYFSLVEMSKCSHLLENMLHEVRDGRRVLDERLKALLLTYIDIQKEVMKRAKECAMASIAMTTSLQAQAFLSDLHSYAQGESTTFSEPPAAKAAAAIEAPVLPQKASAPAATSVPERVSAAPDSSSEKGDKLQVKNFVKVDTARLDQLIDSIGEMVIYSSMLVRQCREHLEGDQTVMNTTHRVEKFGRDLQDIGMSMRLVPIKGLFQKMSRLVWDASKKLGKELDFQVDGEDTELDRNLIDKLADPLMHMVRNAIDHGIESPEVREAAGKPRAGRVKLAAYYAGGSIHIEISDDGKGLDPEKLIAKALEKGIITPSQRLTNEEAYQLIFAAGFSTAAVVTDISGRGVGMDVVRRNVESLRGRIRIRSEVGRGSTFTIELPLTLAIIDGIQVRVGKENFIIPSLSIVEFVRPALDTLNVTLDRGETFTFRNKYLPVFRLSHLYGIESPVSDLSQGALVVVENGTEYVALAVDAILGEYSTVIKNLGPMFAEQKGTAGCAIMPDGDISLILDVRSLIELAREVYRAPSGSEAGQIPAQFSSKPHDSHA